MISSLLSPQSLSGAVIVLVDAAVKGAVLVAIAAVAARLLAKRSAAARHAVWTAAIAGQLLIPILGTVLPSWRVPLLPAPWSTSATTASTPDKSSVTPAPVVTQGAAKSSPSNVPGNSIVGSTPKANPTTPAVTGPTFPGFTRPEWLTDSRAVMAAIWMLGVMIVLLRLAIGTVRVGVLARDGERVDDGRWLSLTQRVANALGVERPLILLRGERLAVPVTWGVVYPAVLLPPEADEWPEERRRFVLVHELAHVKRFDALTQLVAQITLALFWFNPLVWVAAHQMRVEREHACDDYVLRDGTPASLYAGELLEMVRSIGTPAHESAAPAFAALAMARRSEFEGRMLAILDSRLDRKTINRKATIMTGAFIALLALPLAALRPFDTEAATVVRTPALVQTASHAASAAAGSATIASKTSTPVTTASPLSCDRLDGRSSGTSIHSNISDDGDGITQIVIVSPRRCISAAINGKVHFSADEHSVTSIGLGSLATFRERVAGRDMIVLVRAGANGAPEYEARVDGNKTTFVGPVQQWFSQLLPEILREGAINVPDRVARIKAQGGVSAVLDEISKIQGSGAKRAHYEALLGTHLTDAETERVLRQAPRDLASSSGDLSAVLRKLPRKSTASPTLQTAVGDALARVTSSGDRETTMSMLVPTADRELLLTLIRAATGIESDGDRARFLMTSAASYLSPNDKELHEAYFRTASTISSDGDLARVLISAAPYGHANGDVVTGIFLALSHIGSSGDRANVLMSMASQRLITTKASRDAYTKAALGLSEGDSRNALGVLLQSGQ